MLILNLNITGEDLFVHERIMIIFRTPLLFLHEGLEL